MYSACVSWGEVGRCAAILPFGLCEWWPKGWGARSEVRWDGRRRRACLWCVRIWCVGHPGSSGPFFHIPQSTMFYIHVRAALHIYILLLSSRMFCGGHSENACFVGLRPGSAEARGDDLNSLNRPQINIMFCLFNRESDFGVTVRASVCSFENVCCCSIICMHYIYIRVFPFLLGSYFLEWMSRGQWVKGDKTGFLLSLRLQNIK